MLDLGETLGDSTPLSPLIFVLSAGVDPTQILRKLAVERGMDSNFFTVALGQGQVGASICQPLCIRRIDPTYLMFSCTLQHSKNVSMETDASSLARSLISLG